MKSGHREKGEKTQTGLFKVKSHMHMPGRGISSRR
jgi:hypothetical protein